MVIAIAGRRIDPSDAHVARFPVHNVPLVRQRIREALTRHGAAALVASAACGSDLLALDEAGVMGLERRIVLPFDRARFRRSSVVDRPGAWGALFDRIVDEVSASGHLVTLAARPPDDHAAYRAATDAIVSEAVRLAAARHEPPCAIAVWDGRSRGAGDLTEAFVRDATARGLPVFDVPTI